MGKGDGKDSNRSSHNNHHGEAALDHSNGLYMAGGMEISPPGLATGEYTEPERRQFPAYDVAWKQAPGIAAVRAEAAPTEAGGGLVSTMQHVVTRLGEWSRSLRNSEQSSSHVNNFRLSSCLTSSISATASGTVVGAGR